MTVDVILTADAASGEWALEEVVAAARGATLSQWLAPGVGLVTLLSDWTSLAWQLRVAPPIFCRHICPVETTVDLMREAVDLEALAAAGSRFVDDMDETRPFSVQTRLLGKRWPYGPYDVNTRLAEVLARSGASLDVRKPVDVLSVVLAGHRGYLGLSRADDNLSDWAGGMRRLRRDPQQISRAEFKLVEALEVFGLDLSGTTMALDLGAAPGGWTRILRGQGARVVAVDPADLAHAILQDAGVHHVRQTSEAYLATTDQVFDVILNDMRMDARDSARVMVAAAGQLRPSGWALMTLKLPQDALVSTMEAALKILKRSYDVIGVRQLFHNRSEVTVALRRADSTELTRR